MKCTYSSPEQIVSVLNKSHIVLDALSSSHLKCQHPFEGEADSHPLKPSTDVQCCPHHQQGRSSELLGVCSRLCKITAFPPPFSRLVQGKATPSHTLHNGIGVPSSKRARIPKLTSCPSVVHTPLARAELGICTKSKILRSTKGNMDFELQGSF